MRKVKARVLNSHYDVATNSIVLNLELLHGDKKEIRVARLSRDSVLNGMEVLQNEEMQVMQDFAKAFGSRAEPLNLELPESDLEDGKELCL